MLQVLPKGYKLRRPLWLVIHQTDTCYWASSESGFLHGTGKTQAEAVEDYGYALVDYYECLRSQRDRLAPHLQDQLEQLNGIMSPTESPGPTEASAAGPILTSGDDGEATG